MRSAIVSASSWSWVTMIVVTPRRRWSCLISWRRCTRTFASSADSGSSSKRSPGEVASARASATRCCWPPESCAGYLLPCVGQSHQVEQLQDAPGDLGARHPRVLEPVRDVPGGGQVGEERVGLEHDAEITLGRRQRGDVAAALLDPAGRLDVQAGDRPEQGCLATSRRAKEADELALDDLQRDVVEGGEGAELLGEPADPEVRRRSRSPYFFGSDFAP